VAFPAVARNALSSNSTFVAAMTGTESTLTAELERVRRLNDERAASPRLAAALDRIAEFQARRLAATYSDLARDPRYKEAIAFFSSDLYGPGDFSRRDADLARVVPTLRRVMPSGVIATVTMAIQLTALSQELDRALLVKLGADAPLSVASYCIAYRACANRGGRTQQIALIGKVGHGLDRYVHSPLLRRTLAVMRVPARAAGLATLQRFIESGVSAFARMRVATEFLETIDARETALMNAILAGDDTPFPEPRCATS
jgi:hypothetical protein